MTEMRYRSHCFCGACELEISGEPVAQAYCHCGSCRGWLGAPIHAAALWPSSQVRVLKGADKLHAYEKTPASVRHFCTVCGGPVLVRHPVMGMTDVPAGTIEGFDHHPTVHVHYAEKVMPVKDGIPKFKDFPTEFGGSGEQLPE